MEQVREINIHSNNKSRWNGYWRKRV